MIKTNSRQNKALTTSTFGKIQMTSAEKTDDINLELSDLTVSGHMNEKEIKPPLHVWDRIVTVLDEQDRLKFSNNRHQPVTYTSKAGQNRKLLFATIALTIVVGILWYLA